MPQAAAAWAAFAAAHAFAAGVVEFAVVTALATAVSFGLSTLLAPKIPTPGSTHMVKQPLIPRRIIYGRARVGAAWAHAESDAKRFGFLRILCVWADGPCEAVEKIYLDEKPIALSADGYGRTAPVIKKDGSREYLRVKTHLGTETQTADSDAKSELTSWTDSHKLAGVCYSYITIRESISRFETGLPNISAVIRGRKDIYDPRNEYTITAVDAGADTLTHAGHGLEVEQKIRLHTADTMPGGLEEDTFYFVESVPSADTFTLAATAGGAAIDITGAGAGALTYSKCGYTDNAALCFAHYLTMPATGPNCDYFDELDETRLIAAANVCDEEVETNVSHEFSTSYAADENDLNSANNDLWEGARARLTTTGTLPSPLAAGTDYYVLDHITEGGYLEAVGEDWNWPAQRDGTVFWLAPAYGGDPVTLTSDGSGDHTITVWEKRYAVNGVIGVDVKVEDLIQQFRSAMAGYAVYVGGVWKIYPGAYITPTLEIDEDMLIGGIEMSAKAPKTSRVNAVRGTFRGNSVSQWQESSFPAVTDASYVSADGEELDSVLDLAFVNSPYAGQRCAKIILEKSRRMKSVQLRCNIEAFRVTAGQTCKLTIPRLGFNAAPMDVVSSQLGVDDGVVFVELALRETAAAVYDWDHTSDETRYSISRHPVDFDDEDIERPAGLGVAADTDTYFVDNAGNAYVDMVLSWDAASDLRVSDEGKILISWKPSAESAWQSTVVNGDESSVRISRLPESADYDYEVVFETVSGWRSEPASITDNTTPEWDGTGWTAQVAAPAADPAGGVFAAGTDVELSCATTGADIRYNITPIGAEAEYPADISDGTLYAGAFNVNNQEIWAKAFKDNYIESNGLNEAYPTS